MPLSIRGAAPSVRRGLIARISADTFKFLNDSRLALFCERTRCVGKDQQVIIVMDALRQAKPIAVKGSRFFTVRYGQCNMVQAHKFSYFYICNKKGDRRAAFLM